MRRAEEAKKDKTAANRKEEELQLKDSIVRIPSPHHALRFCGISEHSR